ncbi:MAG: hypothetical protein IT371_27885 [Deltaproteobacteria bacterium]|nr:hypothetical protein [Deltaproteobacteria bacterium]
MAFVVATADQEVAGSSTKLTAKLKLAAAGASAAQILGDLDVLSGARSAVLDAGDYDNRKYGFSGSNDFFEVTVEGSSALIGVYDVLVDVFAQHTRVG